MWAVAALVLLAALLGLALPGLARTVESPIPPARPEAVPAVPGRGSAGTVRDRPRPDYDAAGLPLGAFRLFPAIETALVYDSNLFRASGGGDSSLLARVSPSISLESGWSRHGFTLAAAGDLGAYAGRTSENFANGEIAAGGFVDIQRGLRLEASAAMIQQTEERGSVDGDGGVEPVRYLSWSAQAAVAGERGRLGYRIGADYARANYHDAVAPGGGVLNQDDRDFQSIAGFAQVGYRVLADGGVFLAGRYGVIDFAETADDNGTNRDGQNQILVAGLAMDFGGITFGQVYAGWFGEQFDDVALEPVSGLLVGAEVTSNITPLTTLTLRLDRETQATVTAGTSTLVETGVQARADHELLRNLLLSASVGARRLAFEGIDRTDDHWAAGLGADWLVNRNMRLRLHYDFDTRASHGAAAVAGWRRHVAGVRLVLQR